MVTLNATVFHKSRAADKAIACGLVIASLLVGLAIVELFGRFLVAPGPPIDQWDRLISLFQGGGTVFENHGPIFTYVPHKDIRNLAVYFSDQDFTTEYDYRFHTNNFGLVQDSDIEPTRPSLLLLGDSFTEGMGAEPWFRKLTAQNDKLPLQLINGGLRGTGFTQWSLLERQLAAAKFDIKKLIVLFITDDYPRPVGNASQKVLHCLASVSLSECPNDNIHIYYPLPPADELRQWVGQIRDLRADNGGVLLKRLGRIMPTTHLLYNILKEKFSPTYRAAEIDSRASITRLLAERGADNVAFLHLPEKDEINQPKALGLRIRQDIRDAGGKLYDGFKLCGLTPADYHVHDDHPNEKGYDKIARCVGQVVRIMTKRDQSS